MSCFTTPSLLLNVFPNYKESQVTEVLVFEAMDLTLTSTLKPGVYIGEIDNSCETHSFLLLVNQDQKCDYYCTYGGYDEYNTLTYSVGAWFDLLYNSCNGDVVGYTNLMVGKDSISCIEEYRDWFEHMTFD